MPKISDSLSLRKKFSQSVSELTNVRSISVCAMLLALRVVIGYFSNFTLTFTPSAKIGFSFLPIAAVGILFGPVCALIVGGLGDIISFVLAPMGAYFFGWTLNSVLVGLIYGVFLYRSSNKLLNIIICELIILFLIEVPLGSLWLYIQFNRAFIIMTATRAVKSLIALPIETFCVYSLAKVLNKVKFIKT